MSALLSGLTGICRDLPWFLLIPPVLIIALPAAVLLPGVYALFMYSAAGRRRQGESAPALGTQLKTHAAALFLTELLYILFLYLLWTALSVLLQQALDTYLAAAAAHQVRQIGTPEQLSYARMVLLSLQGAGAVYLLGFAFIMNLCCALYLNSAAPYTTALRAWLKNLPAFLTLILLACLAFAQIEQSFAAEKMEHLKELWSGGSAEPWYLWGYMLLRLYVCQALLTACMLAAGAACGSISLKFKKTEEASDA